MNAPATHEHSRSAHRLQSAGTVLTAQAGLRIGFLGVLGALTIVAGFLVPPVPGTSSPPDAFAVLSAITIIMVLVVLWLRRSLNISLSRTVELPLPLYTLFLAAAILSGTSGAVIIAAVASLHRLLPGGSGRAITPERVEAVLRGAVVAAISTLAAGAVYRTICVVLGKVEHPLHAHLVAGVAATLVILAGVSISRILERQWGALWSSRAWADYLGSPAFRFQVLLLSIGPLLPLVEVLDDVEAELAWVLFLVPLYAIYYLALLSVRLQERTDQLQERTDELQRTIQALAVARERQAELTGYAALITRAQEEERRRLSRELHDDTAQALIALSRGLDALATRPVDPPLSPRDRDFLTELGHLAKRTLDGIRRACQNLRPSVLDDLGLAAALESLASSLSAQGVPCDYTRSGEPRALAPEVEVTVYRIAQEAVSNALRHAEADHVTISLSYAPDALRLVVRDDGRGFDVSRHALPARSSPEAVSPVNAAGLGLLGMRERAALIGATLDLSSAPGEGTVVTILVPTTAPSLARALALAE